MARSAVMALVALKSRNMRLGAVWHPRDADAAW
jgi:hypothetical protein